MAAAVLAFLHSACTEPVSYDEDPGSERLILAVEVPQMTKSPVYSQYLPPGSEIGVTLVEEGKDTYDGATYHNLMFTAYGREEDQFWVTSSEIELSDTKGKLYVYYPYTSSYDSHSISASDTDTDVLWYSVSDVSRRNNIVRVQLDHKKAIFRIKLVRGDYEGHGNISSVDIIGRNTYRYADLDILSGEYRNGEVIGMEMNLKTRKLDEVPTIDFLVMPNGKNDYVIITSHIDEVLYQINTEAFTALPGKVYEFTVTLNKLTGSNEYRARQTSLNIYDYEE